MWIENACYTTTEAPLTFPFQEVSTSLREIAIKMDMHDRTEDFHQILMAFLGEELTTWNRERSGRTVCLSD